MKLDLIVKNVIVVRPNKTFIELLDLRIKDGRFTKIVPKIDESEALEGFDGKIFSVFLDWWMPIYIQEFIPLWVKMPLLKVKLPSWRCNL